MKNKHLQHPLSIFFILSLFMPQNATTQNPYCASKSTTPWELWLSNVQFNTLNNTSDKFKDHNTLGYSDYSEVETSVIRGQNYPLSITPSLNWVGNLPNMYCRVWIDFNQNNVFENSELVVEESNKKIVYKSVLVPPTAPTGKTRMRVSVKWGSYPMPCDVFESGEVEDYSVRITQGVVNNTPRYKDSLELVGLYHATDGANWTNKWHLNTPIHTWFGVSMSPYADAVEKIELKNNNLKGSLPNLSFIYLYILDLSNNSINGIIPNFNVQNILTLNLQNNRLTGSIPNFNYAHLGSLYLQGNLLTGTIPDFLLPQLYFLNLSYNDLSGEMPAFKLPSVVTINLRRNKLSGTIPNINCPNLNSLILDLNQFSGTLPNFTLRNLQELTLQENQLTGAIPDFDLPKLYLLILDVNKFTDTIPNFNLPNLQYLSLTNNQLVGKIPNFNLPKLKDVRVSYNKLTGAIPDFNLPDLTNIWLNDNQLSGCIPASFAYFCGKSVNIRNNPNLDTQNFSDFCNNNTGMCHSSNLPDLTLDNLSISTPSVEAGQLLNFTFDAKNIGLSSVPNSFTIKSYLSRDAQLSADDYQDGTILTANYNAGQVIRSIRGAMTISNNLSAGNYYLIVKIDADNQIVESNDLNNTQISSNLITITTTPTNSCRYQDSLELVRFYNATNGANWVVKWHLNTPINTWDGIYLDKNGCVESIILVRLNNNAVGTLPNLNFPNLQRLELYDMQLTGNIPNFNCPNLAQLSLTSIPLTGTIPNFNYPKLIGLNLWHLAITGNVPNFDLPNLRSLFLSSNQLNGAIPNFNLPKLIYLSLNDNKLSGTIPNFNLLPNLQKLNLGKNQLIDTIPNFIFLPNLQEIRLDNNKLAGKIPYFNCPTLSDIYLDNNQLSGSIPNFNYTNLTTLILHNNQLSGTIPNFHLPNLQILYLFNNQLSGAIPSFSMPNLSQLILSSNQLSGCIPTSLRLYCGRTVRIDGNWGLINQNFATFCSNNIGQCTSGEDIALNLTATPSVYGRYSTHNFKISAKNNGNAAFTNVKIKFTRPENTVNGGTKIASIGTFNDYCMDGIECSEWTIPSLASGTTATLDAPIYILTPTGTITASANLLSSTPTDNVSANNTASLLISPSTLPTLAPIIATLTTHKPTSALPIVIQKLNPTVTETEINVEIESLMDKDVELSIANAMGQTVLVQKRTIHKGMNTLRFDVGHLPQGLYFIQANMGKGRAVPTKFIKF